MIKTILFHKITKTILKIAIPLGILAWLFLKLDLVSIKDHLGRTDVRIFLFSFTLLCFRNVVGAYRSSVLLRYRKFDYSLAALTRYYFIGCFFNLFLPAVVGRDIARGYYLYQTSSGQTETIGSIVVERFIGTAALMLLTLASIGMALALGLDIIKNNVIQVIAVSFGMCCVFVALFFYEKTERLLEKLTPASALSKIKPAVDFIHDILNYNKAPLVLFHTFLSSLVFQLTGVISTWLIAVSLGSTTDFINFLVLLPVVWFIGMLPVSVNGLGVREGSFVVLFRTVGMADEMSMAICILWFVQNVGLGIIGGILFVTEGNAIAKAKQYRKASKETS